jgi:hypothetical protein
MFHLSRIKQMLQQYFISDLAFWKNKITINKIAG